MPSNELSNRWRLAVLTVMVATLAPSVAQPSQPLATCLSREKVAVSTAHAITGLEGVGSTPASSAALFTSSQTWLRSLGAGVTAITPGHNATNGVDGLTAALDQAGRQNATLLVAVTATGQEQRLNHPYLSGDQYPLRTIRLQLAIAAIDIRERNVVAVQQWTENRAAYSSDEAVSNVLADTFSHKLTETLHQACEGRAPPVRAATTSPPPPPTTPRTAKEKKESEEKIDLFVRICVSGGSKSELRAEAGGEGRLNLRRLNADGSVGGQIEFNRSTAEMLVEGITNNLSPTAAAEADKIRACLKPVRDWMARTYFP